MNDTSGKLKIFSIYDSKAEIYMRPFYERSTGLAVRAFSDEVNSKKEDSLVAKHPEDFTLFEIGTLDEISCTISQYEAKKSLGTGNDHVRNLN